MTKLLARAKARGVRPDWMFRAARECQILAGAIALGHVNGLDIGAALRASVPLPANDLERYILDTFIWRSHIENNRSSMQSGAAVAGNSLAHKAARTLRERYAEPWTIRLLAKELATNRFCLTSEFKATHGVGVHAYLVACRLEAARRLVRNGEKVEVSARAVGFRSKKTLYNSIKRLQRE